MLHPLIEPQIPNARRNAGFLSIVCVCGLRFARARIFAFIALLRPARDWPAIASGAIGRVSSAETRVTSKCWLFTFSGQQILSWRSRARAMEMKKLPRSSGEFCLVESPKPPRIVGSSEVRNQTALRHRCGSGSCSHAGADRRVRARNQQQRGVCRLLATASQINALTAIALAAIGIHQQGHADAPARAVSSVSTRARRC